MKIHLKNNQKFLVLALTFIMLSFFTSVVKAQFQEEEFSGGKKSSYQCFDPNTNQPSEDLVSDVQLNGYWLCKCNDGAKSDPGRNGICGDASADCSGLPGSNGCTAQQATIKPPKLQQLEIWFVRVLYAIWALVGSLSFIYLMVLAYRYVITRGDVTKITEIRQKIIYYFIGLAVVFLAVPILTTVFRVLGINRNVECYNVQMPAFQFFFTDLCTDPDGTIATNPCSAITEYSNEYTSDNPNATPEQARDYAINRINGTTCATTGAVASCGEVRLTFPFTGTSVCFETTATCSEAGGSDDKNTWTVPSTNVYSC